MSNESNQQADRDGKTSANKQRTPAQKEASRKNGAKSRGPVSQAGKGMSRQNALKHGLTAKFLTPPRDPRNQDQLYEQVHQELINEYEPESFTAESTVSNLAHDYVQMIRCRQMMEALQRPAPLSRDERDDWDRMQRHKEERQILSDAIACIVAREDLNFPMDVARTLAAKVAALVKQTRQDIDEISDYDKEGPPNLDDPDPFEPEEIEEKQQLWGTIKPLRRLLAEEDHLARVFSGDAVPTSMESKRLVSLLKTLDEYAALRDSLRPEVEAKIDTFNDTILMKLAREPERIMLLDRYLRDIERSIDRKMKQLRDLQSLGSFRENESA